MTLLTLKKSYCQNKLSVFQQWQEIYKRQRKQKSNCQYLLNYRKSKRVPEKYQLLLYWACKSLWLCGSQQIVENSERDRNTDHLTCLLRNWYAGQKATVRTGHGTDWFQIRKGVHKTYILSPCLFKLYTEYIMRNAGLDEAQAGSKIARRSINNLK